ncbi:mandelate racemase/muconate lactonizing enzyme family protein [Pseudonocardia hispaniensis]|uniref:Mandelate racemase/muconate lactonizing enzyme family protein n=1 Tax=Pseudonocardia hispaniensis TaxID=904933 RepID=A0ABW1J7H4_9PSEU
MTTIEQVEFVGLRSALDPPATFSWGMASERNVGLVRVRTSDGVDGWGETSVTFPLWSLEERHATVDRGLAPLVTGEPCGDIDEIAAVIAHAERSMARLRHLWSPVGISGAIGALEMALLDAWGQSRGAPVWELLGGERAAVPLYAVGFTGGPDAAAEQAVRCVGEGYRSVKVRVGFGEQTDLAQLATFRRALGARTTILADVNMGWDRATAAAMLPKLAEFDLGWLEEPLPRDDLAGLVELSDISPVPLAAGENCYTRAEALALVGSGAVRYVMPDLARCGGLLTALDYARAALDRGLQYSPHHYASDIGFSAMLTLCAIAGSPAPILRDVSPWPLRSDLLTQPVDIQDGQAWPSAEPGLAPRPDPAVIEKHRVL